MQRRLRWTDHVIRMREDRLPKAVLYGELAERRRRVGGPKKRHKDQLKSDMKTSDIRPDQLDALSQDRSRWRQVCQSGVRQSNEKMTSDKREGREDSKWLPDQRIPLLMGAARPCGRHCASRIGLHSH